MNVLVSSLIEACDGIKTERKKIMKFKFNQILNGIFISEREKFQFPKLQNKNSIKIQIH